MQFRAQCCDGLRELLFNCKSLTRCVGVNYADISRGYFSSVLFSPGKKHFIWGCGNQNTTLHSLTLSHMCFLKRKHFSLTTVPFSPGNLGVRDGPGKSFAVFSFGEAWRSVPLSILLTQGHAHAPFLLPAEGCVRSFPLSGRNLVPLGTTEVIQAKLSQGKSYLLIRTDPTLPPLCSTSAIL